MSPNFDYGTDSDTPGLYDSPSDDSEEEDAR